MPKQPRGRHPKTAPGALIGPNRGRGGLSLPPVIDRAGAGAQRRAIEFFGAEIRNPNTRRAYMTAASRFFAWCDDLGLDLPQVETSHVAAYIELLTHQLAPLSVKQHLAALRTLLDYLVTGQVIAHNPAAAVRGPRVVYRTGKTPVLYELEARELFASIDVESLSGVRDRAILAVMTYAFARVGAVVAMRVRDFGVMGRRAWFVLHEKGGRHQQVPAHRKAADAVEMYLDRGNLAADRDGPLFRSLQQGQLTHRPLLRQDVWRLIKRRALAAGLSPDISCHSFRASGITNYLTHGGTLERAAAIAGHASTRTTQLYNRLDEEISLDEIEKIRI